MTLKLPGLVDPHVHVREPGAIHKEDWDTATSAALAGGFTAILAMPNTSPPVTDEETLEMALSAAQHKARCDYAQYLGAGPENSAAAPFLAGRVAGLKMYLDQTYGPLRLDDMRLWMAHFEAWPKTSPVVVHAEQRSLAAALLVANLCDHPLHVAHISLAEEIILIRRAKDQGLKVTCEVAPHHLFLTQEDLMALGNPGRIEVRPRLATPADQQVLWDNLDVIDCFATDHAPHTLAEKDGSNPPPGFPGLETALPLLLTAVHAGRLTLDDLVDKMAVQPRRIFGLPDQEQTWIEIDPDADWTLQSAGAYTRCGWTPFEGRPVRGRVERVVIRGREVYKDGQVLARPGFGLNLRDTAKNEIM